MKKLAIPVVIGIIVLLSGCPNGGMVPDSGQAHISFSIDGQNHTFYGGESGIYAQPFGSYLPAQANFWGIGASNSTDMVFVATDGSGNTMFYLMLDGERFDWQDSRDSSVMPQNSTLLSTDAVGGRILGTFSGTVIDESFIQHSVTNGGINVIRIANDSFTLD